MDEPDLAAAEVGEATAGPACAKGFLGWVQRGLSPNQGFFKVFLVSLELGVVRSCGGILHC